MFALEITLLTGRYVATSFDDRGRAEWPPHPARLFSALCATHFEALEPPVAEREALAWLERQGAPEITAPEASAREVVTVFVPVNDTSVVGSLDKELGALDEARAEMGAAKEKGGKALAAAEKKLAKAAARLEEATRKAIAPVAPGKEGKEGPADAVSLLPERRTRQPRTFPSVAPEEIGSVDPQVVFVWPEAEPSLEQRSTLDALAARVVRLGHSSSLASVRVREDRPAPTWVPDAVSARPTQDTTVLRVVGSGQVEALSSAFERLGDAPGRVMPAAFQRYVRPRLDQTPELPTTLFGDDWIVLRRVDGPRLPSIRAVDIARALRNALMAAHGPDAPEVLSGHRPSGSRSERPHMAYLPLPFVASQHADGSILGVALVLPREATEEERITVYRTLHRWEGQERQGDEDTPRLPLLLGRSGVLGVARLEDEAAQSTLRASTWCAASRIWSSATPVALDRNPGDLRSSDPTKEAAAYAEAEATIAASCVRLGLPAPLRVTVQPAAPLAGADKARHFPPFSTGKPPVQRVLVHATLIFATRVTGPILLGAGRYFGLGLFRPLGDHG